MDWIERMGVCVFSPCLTFLPLLPEFVDFLSLTTSADFIYQSGLPEVPFQAAVPSMCGEGSRGEGPRLCLA